MSRGKPGHEHDDAGAVAKLLRELAERAENDPAFGAKVAEAVRASGLLESASATPAPARTKTPRAARAAGDAPARAEVLDPFQVLRQHGTDALRERLEALDIATLRLIVRAHRLDPARISARWTATERVVSLIVDQVRARANLGRAFERI